MARESWDDKVADIETLLMELKTMTVDLETLRGMPLFADLDEPAMFSLSGAAEQSYPRGATIVRANEPARSVFIVREGGVKEAQITPEGKEVILALHGPGDLFGELAQFHGNQVTATCTTLLPTKVLMVPREDWERMIDRAPAAGARPDGAAGAAARRLVAPGADALALHHRGAPEVGAACCSPSAGVSRARRASRSRSTSRTARSPISPAPAARR